MKIKDIELSKLKPATYNPRQITKKQVKDLMASIEKFGIIDPLIINSDFTIVGGHQRFAILNEASKRVDWEDPPKVPCVILDLSKEDERELNIRLNKNTGDWDFDILGNEFEIQELKEWGFKEIELGLNIDKIKQEEDIATITIKEADLIKAQELYNDLEEKGYNVKIK
tara:strand:- start:47 stop:553 length:507 start_codon:yes stop_codon:yes gene_type:complete